MWFVEYSACTRHQVDDLPGLLHKITWDWILISSLTLRNGFTWVALLHLMHSMYPLVVVKSHPKHTQDGFQTGDMAKIWQKSTQAAKQNVLYDKYFICKLNYEKKKVYYICTLNLHRNSYKFVGRLPQIELNLITVIKSYNCPNGS